MNGKQQESVFFYKILEAEINKSIHARTNCQGYTLAFGRALNAHVKQARIHKRLTTRWLNRLDIPNKDEIAALSNRIVDYEGKLDTLEETIYYINKRQQENQFQLKMVQKSWEELRSLLEEEISEIHDNKFKTLEKELLDLKQLFQIEFIT